MNSSQYDFSFAKDRLGAIGMGKGSLYGLERECLRVTSDGRLALSPHPKALGASLTHPAITTDFSESQIEFTTQPYGSLAGALQELEELQNFVCSKLSGEYLWPLSMPAVLPEKDEEIPLAYFGDSPQGEKKTIYRRGLGHRYGRRMQTISGIHFNFSFGDELLKNLARESRIHVSDENFLSFKNDVYFHVIRNFYRRAAAIPYLYGASPAVDRSFFRSDLHRIPGRLKELGKRTLFHPTATSLRLSGIGYTNPNQRLLRISYNGIEDYLDSMEEALNMHCEDYAAFSVENKQQLNANLLQIENEHYAPIRPKPDMKGYERAKEALRDNGVCYIEIRGLDLNPFTPIAVDGERLAFVEMLLYDCLFSPSPELSNHELAVLEQDFQLAVWRGREPNLRLSNGVRVSEIGTWLCRRLSVYADLLDSEKGGETYRSALESARASFADSELTPSARLLSEIREMGDLLDLGRYYSQEYCRYFGQHRLSADRLQELEDSVRRSLQEEESVTALMAPV